MSPLSLTFTIVFACNLLGIVRAQESKFESLIMNEIQKLRSELNEVKTENGDLRTSLEILTEANQALNIRLNKLEKLNSDTQKYMDLSIATGNNSYTKKTIVKTEADGHNDKPTETKPNGPVLSRISRAPGEVAFHAYMSTSKCLGSHEVFIFDVEMTDLGGGYNNHDGIFDVPVTGIYVLTFTVYSEAHYEVRAELIIDGQVKTALLADADEINDYHTGTATIVVQVNAGDHIFVRRADTYSESCVMSRFDRALTTFSGWLLY